MAIAKRLQRRVNSLLGARGHIDAVAGNRISGWAVARSGAVRVQARIGDSVVASVSPQIERGDVEMAFPGYAFGRQSGFMIELPAGSIPTGAFVDVTLEALPQATFARPATLGRITLAGHDMVKMVAQAPAAGIVGPFPRGIIDAVATLWPESCLDLTSPEGQAAFVQKFGLLLRVPELRSIPIVADYARYLQAIWAHFSFVDRFFPTQNSQARADSADFHCKPNSVFEILAIAHQLYVLKSYGVEGDFAEFGCFKGFSSAMLSYACQQLGLRMHIFDSFEGLPPAEGSGYGVGDYAGSLEEVTANVTRYGAVSVVEFHKGFFSDTFRHYRPPALMGLWMDVDLEVSSQDLVVVADRLDPRSTIFSHECTPEIFRDGMIVTAAHPDNPIPPLLARFEELDRPLTGRFIRGNTGAFWPRKGGIPALDNQVLLDLKDLVI